MKSSEYKKGRRVLARVAKNEWHAGTIAKVTRGGVYVDFDDGLEAKVEPEDYKDLHVFEGGAPRIVKVLTDVQANALRGISVPKKKIPISDRPELVFTAPDSDVAFNTAWAVLKKWLSKVAAKYKISDTAVTVSKKLGSVGIVKVFSGEDTPTKLKYQRMVKELSASFRQSGEWRSQAFSGAPIFFSNNGLYQAVFYDIPHVMRDDDKRQIGFYIKTSVPK